MARNLLQNKLRINPGVLNQMRAFVRTTHIPLRLLDAKGTVLWGSRFFKTKSNFCNVVQSNGFLSRRCLRAHKESVRESLRWGEAIISKCCYFMMQIGVPVLEGQRWVGNLIAAPFLLVPPSELQPEERVIRYRHQVLGGRTLEKALSSIAIVKDEEAKEAAQALFQLADHLSDPDLGELIKVREAQILQGKIADQICDLKNLDRDFTAPSLSRLFYEREREIITKIRLGDRNGAKGILYQLLAIILIQHLENFELLKVSILELLLLLTRAAVEAGSKIEEMLGIRYGFVTELARIKDQETLCLWVVKVLEKLMDGIYETRHAKNYQRLKKTLDFIEAHYGDPLKVDQIAGEVYLSPSRLSHIIKEELGITLGEYISRVRIEKAKVLLKNGDIPISQIALGVGYPDQSYFTKVFKRIEQCTPKVFRQNALQSIPLN